MQLLDLPAVFVPLTQAFRRATHSDEQGCHLDCAFCTLVVTQGAWDQT